MMQDGRVNEAALCSQQLDRSYGPLREQVAQSLKRQDTVLRQLKVAMLALILFIYLRWLFSLFFIYYYLLHIIEVVVWYSG